MVKETTKIVIGSMAAIANGPVAFRYAKNETIAANEAHATVDVATHLRNPIT